MRADVGPWAAYEFAREIANFDMRLGDRVFAMGGRFTAADVMLGSLRASGRGGQKNSRSRPNV